MKKKKRRRLLEVVLLAEERLITFVSKFNFFLRKLLAQTFPTQIPPESRVNTSERYFPGDCYCGCSSERRVSGAKAEGKPVQGSGIKLEPLWETQVVHFQGSF